MAVKNVQARVLLRKAVTFKNAQVSRKHFEFIICIVNWWKKFSLNLIRAHILFLVDCVWSDWTLGTCSVTCGDGVRENHRFKETEALYGGAPCEGVSFHTEPCINRVCPGELIVKSEIETCSDFYYCGIFFRGIVLFLFHSRPMLLYKRTSRRMFGSVHGRWRYVDSRTISFYKHLRQISKHCCQMYCRRRRY